MMTKTAVAMAMGLGMFAAGVSAQTNVYTSSNGKVVRVMADGSSSYAYRVGQGQGAGAGQNTRTKDDLFAGTEQFEKNATSVTEIDMDPDSLEQVRGKDAPQAHSTLLNVVRTYGYDKPGMYDMAAVDKYRDKLNSGDWHCSVHTRELKTGESTDVCQKRRSDDLREDAIITVAPKELTFIHHIKRAGGGHSDMSGLPLIIGERFPVMASLLPGNLAEMQANMAAWQAEHMGEMKEFQAEIKAGLAHGMSFGEGAILLGPLAPVAPKGPAKKAQPNAAPAAPEGLEKPKE